MRAKAKFYKGIEFIQVGDLPADQQMLLQHAKEPERIKILMEGKIIDNCIQFKEYCEWFSSVYTTSVSPAKVLVVREQSMLVKVELSKA